MADTETIPHMTDEGPSRRARVVALATVASIGLILLSIVAFVAANAIGSGDAWDVEPGIPVTVTIASGSSASSIYETLEVAGIARSRSLRDAARSLGVDDQLKAGTYDLTTDMDPEAVVRQLVIGPNSLAGEDFTVIEGWTVERIVSELAAQTGFTETEYRDVLEGGLITSPYLPDATGSINGLTRWEGLLFPATYPISDESTPTAILGAMADEMTRRLDGLDWSRLGELGVTRYEAVILASLIEREAGTEAERPTIASVLYNRLAEPMRLQIDATVIYALGYNPGTVTEEHLAVESPYNTYRIDGLPPTPIGAPSMASLDAATHPATTSYLFYVLGAADGSHLFADTYEGHQENIERAREAGVRP
jgi:peptidoglycan lytic transglycosylase G